MGVDSVADVRRSFITVVSIIGCCLKAIVKVCYRKVAASILSRGLQQ